MAPRYYDAERVDRYLASLRAGFQNAINATLAEEQDSASPRVSMLKELDSLTSRIMTDVSTRALVVLPEPKKRRRAAPKQAEEPEDGVSQA